MVALDEVEIGCWAVLHPAHPQAGWLRNELTIPNPAVGLADFLGHPTDDLPDTLHLYDETPTRLRVPRAFLTEQGRLVGARQVDHTVRGDPVPPTGSRITLSEDQRRFVTLLEDELRHRLGAIIQAPPGFGKTVATLELITRLGLKAVVLVHKEFLLTQWVERITEFLDLAPEQVGIAQQDRCEWEGRSIVVAMAQSLLSRTYPRAFYDSFGLVVVDEVHRFAAPTFHRTIVMFPARRRLGITATPRRADGLEQVFHAHIGPLVGEVGRLPMVPRIYTVTTPVTFSRDTHRLSRPRPYRRGIDTAAIVRYLSRHDDRNQLIVDLLVRAARRGRKILLLTGRRDHALRLRSRLQQRRRRDGESFTVDCYLGGMDRDARQRAQEAQIISATYAMAREGLDIPTLDTLLLATPCGRILQAAGRILRAEECKQEPIVVDLLDPGLPFSLYLAHVRQEEYRALGWRAYPDVELPDLSGHFAALGLQPGQRYQAYRGRGQRPPPREPTGE